jgi:DNA-binding GntR family transcriptional regulator
MRKLGRQTLNDQAYAEIRKGLISGSFRPGQLLAIRALADSYGISTTPMREALQRLVAEKLLAQQSNRTIIVPVLTSGEFVQLYRIRCALEGLAAEQAAGAIGPPHLKALRGILRNIGTAIKTNDRRSYLLLNHKFHFFIYERSEAPLLIDMIQELWLRMGPLINALVEDDEYLSHANDQHWRILTALAAGDVAGTKQRLVDDITVAADALMPRLESFLLSVKIPRGRGRPPTHHRRPARAAVPKALPIE